MWRENATEAGRARVPGMGLNYRDERNSTEPMAVTVAELQGRSREGRLKEAASEPATVGTQTDSEAGCVDELASNGEVQKAIKTHQVESDGMRGQFRVLPGEISCVRALGEVSRGHSSDEARRKPGRAKG